MTTLQPDERGPDLSKLHARLAPIRDLEDGTVHMEPVGIHFHVVTKYGTEIRFWLLEQGRPNTGVIQSEIDLARPLALVEPYTQAMMLGLLWQPEPARVYMAGFGGGRLALLLHHYFPHLHITATELDPQIVRIAERYFAIRQDERLQVQIDDARAWLARRDQRFDLILVDVFLANGYTPYSLATVEFFQLCRRRLQPDGLLVMNILDSDRFKAQKTRTLAAVFPEVWRFYWPEENLILFARNAGDETTGSGQPVDHPALVNRAQALARRHEFDFPFADRAADLERVLPSSPESENLFYDGAPPAGYFDALPSFTAPFSSIAPERPCPCGSGLPFGDCHGARPMT